MPVSLEECRRQALSEDYFDFISDLAQGSVLNVFVEENLCAQRVGAQSLIVYLEGASDPQEALRALSIAPYRSIPKCYGLADLESIAASGIDRLQQYPGLSLSGEGVMIGFIDTGIDYRSPVFRNADGTTRIAGIWDQTDQSGEVPPGFLYGSAYSKEQIDAALASSDPYQLVPETDENGHGTAVAAIAAGNRVESEGFTGAAPGAQIAMVKLKPAKQYLRDYYLIREDAVCYQENDLMLGVLYLQRLAYSQRLPLVVCIALGTNQGDHSGESALDAVLDELCRQRLRAVVCAVGNEANAAHHFQGSFADMQSYQDVELRVGEGERGFTAELWGSAPNTFAVSVISPSGEQLPRVALGLGRREDYTFLFEQTRVTVSYDLPIAGGSDSLVFFRFAAPAAGLWRIRVFPAQENGGDYHIWLPLTAFLSAETYFLQPTPDVTLTEPSGAARPISVGAYDSANGSLYLASGRGYNRRGDVKPDLCAPGVSVLTVQPGRYGAAGSVQGNTEAAPAGTGAFTGEPEPVRFVRKTGTSIAAGITAGAAALLFSWAARTSDSLLLTNGEIKAFLISGANRSRGRAYPNPEWGYGTLDLYQTFERMRIR